MDNYSYNHQFLCKLLGICANNAIIEGAYNTHEIIQNITELIRYMYDPRKNTILLEEEFTAVKNYILIHNIRGMRRNISIEKPEISSTETYIHHLSILIPIIKDIEENSDCEENIDIRYVFKCRENEIILNKNPGNIRITVIKLEN